MRSGPVGPLVVEEQLSPSILEDQEERDLIQSLAVAAQSDGIAEEALLI